MTEKINLKEVEKRIWSSIFQDGLIDIFIGCIVLMFALAPILSESIGDFWSSFIFLPFWALIYILILVTKRNIIIPRTGIVKFGSIRKKKLITVNILISSVICLGLILGIILLTDFNVPGWIHAARFGVIILISALLAAYFLDFYLLIFYGILCALSPIIGEWLWINLNITHHGFPITFGFAASLIIGIGLIKFIRCLKHNPLHKNKVNLKEMEKKAFLDSNQDGIMEMMMGIFFFVIAGYLGTKNVPILLILLPTIGPIWMQLIRNKYTYPRIGHVKPSRKIVRDIGLGIFLYMVIIVLLIFILPLTSTFWDVYLWYQSSLAFIGFITICVFVYIGLKIGSMRYYLLAIISFAGVIASSVIGFDTVEQSVEMYFLGMSGIFIITGIVSFVLFLRKHSVQEVEITDGN